MGWTATTKSQIIGGDRVLHTWSGKADATDLAAAAIFDFSAVVAGGGYTKVRIEWMRILTGGVYLELFWDATTDVHICACPPGVEKIYPPPAFESREILSGAGNFIVDPAGTGFTGDIVGTTTGGAAGDGATVDMVLRLLVA